MLKEIPKSRDLLNMLIFDQNSITWNKPSCLKKFSEEKVLEIYQDTLKETGYVNYDEIIVRVLGYNDAIINSVLLAMTEEQPELRDDIICDNAKWYNDIQKNEVAYRLESISEYVCRVLNKYGMTYIPFMEHKFEKPIFNAFGINGVLTVNDCQNSFQVSNDNHLMSNVGLNAVSDMQCNLIRSIIDTGQVMIA